MHLHEYAHTQTRRHNAKQNRNKVERERALQNHKSSLLWINYNHVMISLHSNVSFIKQKFLWETRQCWRFRRKATRHSYLDGGCYGWESQQSTRGTCSLQVHLYNYLHPTTVLELIFLPERTNTCCAMSWIHSPLSVTARSSGKSPATDWRGRTDDGRRWSDDLVRFMRTFFPSHVSGSSLCQSAFLSLLQW